MFFILSKALHFLILPFTWICILLILSVIIRNPHYRRLSRNCGLILLLLFSNPFISIWVLNKLESKSISIEGTYHTGVVLTGIVQTGIDIPNQLQLNQSSERLTEAIRLYHEGTINSILISGGAADIRYPEQNEGEQLVKLAKTLGVPVSDLILENRSRNTYENSLFTKEALGSDQRPILLITSAFHMTRAMKCFEQQGLKAIPYSVDYRANTDFYWSSLLPSVEALETWNLIIKELVGLLAYRMAGYI